MISYSRTAAAAALLTAALGAGCGASVDATTWLLTVGEDSVTVGEVGTAWNNLEPFQREIFEIDGNTVGTFIVTYGQRLVLEEELRDVGLLDDPDMLNNRHFWLLYRAGATARGLLELEEAGRVTEDDVRFYWDYLGKNVVYTINPGSDDEEVVHAHLPDLPRHIVLNLDTLALGETGVDETGIRMRLEEVTITDSILIRHALMDSSIVEDMAIRGISRDRYVRGAILRLNELMEEYSIEIDEASIDSLPQVLTGIGEMDGDRVIIRSDLYCWTLNDINDQISFYNSMVRIRPDSREWLREFVDILIMQDYFHRMLLEDYPEKIDSLEREADRYLLQTAADEYYNSVVSSTVELTDEDIEHQYEILAEPIMLEEKRTLRVARIPAEMMDEFEQAVYSETLEEFVLPLEGVNYLSADSLDPQLTIPLRTGQVPGGHGEEIFQLTPSDTSRWTGPWTMFTDTDMLLMKLVDVHPPREATLEEAWNQLNELAMARLVEQSTLDIIHQLEEKHGLTVNEDALSDLPSDPGLWSTL